MDYPVERRASERTRDEVKVTLEFEDGSSRKCVTIDVSADGAKLRVPRPASLLGGVFSITGDHPRIRRRRARMVWRRDDEVGIRFV